MGTNELKRKAAEKALDYVESGMILGLGTGSTVHFALLQLAELLKSGRLKNIVGIPTSNETRLKAEELGIPISTLDIYPQIDLVIDGADEVVTLRTSDDSVAITGFELIKGGGGALLREKIIAQAARQFIAVVDAGKLSARLFEKFKLPVEVIKMALNSEINYLNSIGGQSELRTINNTKPFITDEGNFILDVKFQPGQNISDLNSKLNERAGIVEHGLFLNTADKVIVGEASDIKILAKKQVDEKIL